MNQPTQQAIDTLCRRHWLPLYGMARHRGFDHFEAQDAVQEVFMRLLQRSQFATVVQMPASNHQAVYLFTRLNWLLSNRWRDQRRKCRGGGATVLSMSDPNSVIPEPADPQTPDRHLAAAWVHEVLENALERLRCEMKADAWKALEPALRDSGSGGEAQPGRLRAALFRAASA